MYVLRPCLALLLAAVATPAWATFSIVACNEAGDCGVAVATHNLAVGGVGVPWAQAKVGAVASQFETNPTYGSKGLELLATGRSPAQVLKQLLDEDGDFDSTSIAERQIGLVSARGGNAQYTGAIAQRADWAGAVGEGKVSVQGNGLVGPDVLAAMQRAFTTTHGALAARLLAALEAGQAAGGQRSGQWSAALLVRTPGGDWQDTDLRVDADPRAVARLRELYDMRLSNEAIIRAEQQWEKGDVAGARASLATSLALAHGWDRTWARAARLAMSQGETALAREYLAGLRALNPGWVKQELALPLYAPLRGDAVVEAWR
ncbi:UNVERIFIED_ORG: putative Ntn-hydrolase superfamily protein [Stenotrophomonas geniculata]